MDDPGFDIISEEAIAAGKATAEYFLATESVLDAAGRNPSVVAEVAADLDDWHLFAGVKDAAALFKNVPVDVYAVPPGKPIKDAPVLRIEGPYRAFSRYEQSVLGFLAPATAIATRTMHLRIAAGDAMLLNWGTRRRHPATGAMIERAGWIGGADGAGNVAAGDVLGNDPGGTMPHGMLLCFDEIEEAWRMYDETMPVDRPRILLCDTYGDEVSESRRAAETLGDALDGVRLDTPSSRRGDMRTIIEEVRWELDRLGYEEVTILVSGDIDVEAIRELRGVADAFGVGGAIANPDPVDFSMNIVAVDGEPRAKRGVKAGAKTIYRDGLTDTIVPRGESGAGDELLEPLVRNGNIVQEFGLDAAIDHGRHSREMLIEHDALPSHLTDVEPTDSPE
ncbi:MAG: nicotinate phosphoribosyltransferase [Halobacteriales archaeon]